MQLEEAMLFKQKFEQMQAVKKMNYWKQTGIALLEGTGLEEKWCSFVKSQIEDEYIRGAFIDEILQVISMIKLDIPYKVISQIIQNIPDDNKIFKSNLNMFIDSSIINEIYSNIKIKELKK